MRGKLIPSVYTNDSRAGNYRNEWNLEVRRLPIDQLQDEIDTLNRCCVPGGGRSVQLRHSMIYENCVNTRARKLEASWKMPSSRLASCEKTVWGLDNTLELGGETGCCYLGRRIICIRSVGGLRRLKELRLPSRTEYLHPFRGCPQNIGQEMKVAASRDWAAGKQQGNTGFDWEDKCIPGHCELGVADRWPRTLTGSNGWIPEPNNVKSRTNYRDWRCLNIELVKGIGLLTRG